MGGNPRIADDPAATGLERKPNGRWGYPASDEDGAARVYGITETAERGEPGVSGPPATPEPAEAHP